MPEEGTPAPAGQPTAQPTTSQQRLPWRRRRTMITAAGGVALIAAAAAVGGALATRTPHASRPIPAAHAYASTTSVLAAMDRNGVVCSSAGPAGQFTDCSGVSDGDTVIGMFGDHAQALAYADGMVELGLQLHTPTAEVVGPNWVVNTSPAFAGEVVEAIGGEVITKANAQQPRAAAAATAWPASVDMDAPAG